MAIQGRGQIAGSNQAITATIAEGGAVVFDISGTYSGVLVFEGSVDGKTWRAIRGQPIGGGGAVSQTSSTGAWLCSGAGLTGVRVRCSSYTSGQAVIVWRACNETVTPEPIFNWGTPWTGTIGVTALQLSAANFSGYTPSPTRRGVHIVNCSNGVAAGTIRIGVGAAPDTTYAGEFLAQNASVDIIADANVPIFLLGDNASMNVLIMEF